MTSTLLIGVIGLVDLVRRERTRFSQWAGPIVVWLLFIAIAGIGLSVHPVIVATIVVISVGWTVVNPPIDADLKTKRRLWPAVVLLGVLLVARAAGDIGVPDTSILATAYDGLRGVYTWLPLGAIVSATAVTLFLVTSANVVTRSALWRAAEVTSIEHDAIGGPVDHPHSWKVRFRGRVVGDIVESPIAEARPTPDLQGGRLIGPIERVLIVVLALLGAYVLIAALVAAKGVVRFPEISADRAGGTKAEEFLVGSLTSWAIATLAALYLAATIGF